jgi:hypothetical protein
MVECGLGYLEPHAETLKSGRLCSDDGGNVHVRGKASH